METKICSSCNVEKSVNDFHKGRRLKCKECRKDENTPEHRKKVRERYYKKRKQILSDYRDKYANNSKKYIKKAEEYYKNNKDKVREYKSQWTLKKRREDPKFLLITRVRQSIKSRLKYNKRGSTEDYIGISKEGLLSYLGISSVEDLKGNHLDHILPLSLAESDSDVKMLSHYTNLRVIDQKENVKKSNKYVYAKDLLVAIRGNPNKSRFLELSGKIEIWT